MVVVTVDVPATELQYQRDNIHESRATGLVAFLIVALLLSTAFVLARVYVHIISRTRLEAADYTVIAALVESLKRRPI